MSYRWSAYVTPKSRKGGPKSDFLFLGIFKKVTVTLTVYPRFLNLECAQLHSDLFGRRHTTLQPHGLSALAKHFFSLCMTSMS